ncbi:MAG TPA: hypothetical protein VLL76_07635, partial [Candidatus Omnitrophota bacterium]|nr:hypothetical protein [Candidatus Omnitrophota bacterium]
MKLGNILEGGLKAVLNAATSGLAGQIWDTIESALPDDMPPEKRAELKLQLERVAMEREIAGNQAAGEAERNLTERISVLEGTAKDLMAMPILGRLILFARGCQRPAWGFALMVIDYRIFDGSMKVPTEG